MSDTKNFSIGGRRIGPGEPVYIIAEMSANHDQDMDKALRIVEAAAKAGADAVKLQTYTADTLTLDCDKPWFKIGQGTIWEGRTLHDLYSEAYTPWDWQPRLKRAAEDLGLDLFSSPFDFTAVDFLEGMGVPAYKIASFEIVDLPLIRRVAATGKPVVMSTGMASEAEVAEALDAFHGAGGSHAALLKCTSAYPAPPEELNLRTIPLMRERFGVPVGLSDHTLGTAASVAATALGACIIEKHFTLSRADGGPDSAFSLEPDEFRAMVDDVRTAGLALGDAGFGPGLRESASITFRRSLFAVRDIPAGGELTEDNVRSIRPGHGLAPRHYEALLGRRAARDIERGTPLAWDLVEGGEEGGETMEKDS